MYIGSQGHICIFSWKKSNEDWFGMTPYRAEIPSVFTPFSARKKENRKSWRKRRCTREHRRERAATVRLGKQGYTHAVSHHRGLGGQIAEIVGSNLLDSRRVANAKIIIVCSLTLFNI